MPFCCDEVALYDLWCSCRTKIYKKKKHFTFLFFITTSVLKSSEKHLQIFNLAIAALGKFPYCIDSSLLHKCL